MDDRRRQLDREGAGAAAAVEEALGPHAAVENEPEEPTIDGQKDADESDVAIEAVDTDPEYALISVKEGDEEEQQPLVVDSESSAQVTETDEQVGDDDKAAAPPSATVQVDKGASCPAAAPSIEPAPAAAAPETSDVVVIPVDADAPEAPRENTTDADAIVAAPSSTATHREEREEQQQEEAIELSLALSDSSVEPSMSEATQERADVESNCTPVNTDAEVDVAASLNGTSTPLLPPAARRKRKRSKKLSYSNRSRSAALARLKLEGFKPPPVTVASEHTDHAHGKKRHLDNGQQVMASPGQESTFLYPSTPTGTAWQWDSCEMYFTPINQENLDDLERIRKSQANVVAANPRMCRGIQIEHAQLDAMLSDASDRTSAHVRLDQRRGRYYRDVWEEEDFVAAARRKRFALDSEQDDIPAAVHSYHDLVFGYDDDLFRDYVARLESAAATTVADVKKNGVVAPAPQLETESPQPQRTAAATRRSSKQSSSSKRGKKSARSSLKQVDPVAPSPLNDVLPLFPCHQFHPGSLGWWKLAKDKHAKQPDYTAVHPASSCRDRVPVRWREEAKAHRKRIQEEEDAKVGDGENDATGISCDDTNGHKGAESENKAGPSGSTADSTSYSFQDPPLLNLPSFGNDGLEQDEISRAIAASVAKLVPLSMVNWRTLQTVYERAACAQQCASIFDAEAAAKRSLEHLYTSMFASPQELQPVGDTSALPAVSTSSSNAEATMGRGRQPVSLNTRPRDLVAFSSRPSLSGDDASMAVAASVEFAMSLQKGDVADVLDRSGCWNDGVVLDVFVEGGRYPKFVLVRLALWSHEVVEWVGVSEGRLLPRGVAAGKMEFVLSRSQFRAKKLSLTRQIADVLEQSYPQRRARLEAAAQKETQFHSRLMQLEEGKALQKRKRRRVGGAGAAV